jgi:hypothetical protein
MKIGLLISSNKVSIHQYNLIKGLLANDIEVSLININAKDTEFSLIEKLKYLIKYHGIYGLLSKFYFTLQSRLELKLLKHLINDADYFRSFQLNNFNFESVIDVKGNYSKSGLLLRLSDDDIKKVKAANLDALLRINTPGIFKGKILKSSKLGILSFHHGDNRWNRGGPPAFWELYFKKPSTGFVIQILNEKLDGGDVCFRGNTMTNTLFWQINYYNIKNESYSYMLSQILKIKDGIPLKLEDSEVFDNKLYLIPKFHQTLKYQFMLIKNLVNKVFNSIIGEKDKWSVHYVKGNYDKVSMRKATKIKNPKGRFFADPFIVSYNNKDIIFLEDYSYKEKKAVISAVEILSNKEYNFLGSVIKEDFHLSYPYVFEFENELYMIPESSGDKSIRLYKCLNFPLNWEYQYNLISNIDAVDTTMHFINGKYWLLTNSNHNTTEHNSILECYYADSPLSKQWHAHTRNPILFQNGGRNGGYVLSKKKNFLISQKYGYDRYGKSLEIKEIKKITEKDFEINKVMDVNPNFDSKFIGLHHLSSNQAYTCFDTLKRIVKG